MRVPVTVPTLSKKDWETINAEAPKKGLARSERAARVGGDGDLAPATDA